MFQLKLVSKGAGDDRSGKPTIYASELIKAGLIKKAPKPGSKVELTLVSDGGICAVQDFYANRDGSTLYAREGFNSYLFTTPTRGEPVFVGCAGLANQKLESSRPSGLAALNKLLAQYPTKVAAAASIGVSVDTLRRMLAKATAEANVAARSKATEKAVKAVKKVAFKATEDRKATSGRPTKKELKQTLKFFNGNKTAAAKSLGTNRRTFGRWLEAAGL